MNDRDMSINKKETWTYGACNKYFDSINAGLPIVGNLLKMQLDEIDYYTPRMTIRWDVEDYDFDELRCRRRQMKENVMKQREYWLIDNRIDNLIGFYRKV